MGQYYAYILGGDGHIQRREDFDALDDEAAVARARQWVDGRDIEIWQGARMVAVLPAKEGPADPA